jgi:GTPase
MRQVSLPGLDKAILSDTVGFVSDLPTQLVAAFRATLEEVTAADLILHVRDIAHPDSEAQRADVLAVLAEIGVGPEAGEGAPIIEVWNKLDALDPEAHERVVADAARDQDVIAISALSGEGIEALRRTVAERLLAGARVHSIALPAADGGAIAWLHQHGEVIEQEMDGETLTMDVRLSPDEWDRFQSRTAKQA